MTDRHFTLEEANALIPWLQETFEALAPLRRRVERLQREMAALHRRTRTNGGPEGEEQLSEARSAFQEATRLAQEHLKNVQERGIIVRSVEQGLVDFPSLREGREVYLCWMLGEPAVQHWHETDTGFSGRQPL